jgi:hypothetical protein
MNAEQLPLDFGNIPLGSLYEDRLVEDLLLLVDVVSACREGNDARLVELGVRTGVPRDSARGRRSGPPSRKRSRDRRNLSP